MPAPLYTPNNCGSPAYQLDWSYTIFWRASPPDASWLGALQELSEPDHIRILQHEFRCHHVSQFLISTRPSVAPLRIAQRVKGRLQRLLRSTIPKPFRRNYSLRSIGSTRRQKLEQYLKNQIGHHPMVDPRVQERLSRYQIFQPEVDLSEPSMTTHAEYWHNLHIVIVNDQRYMEIRDQSLASLHAMILRVSDSKGHRLSRAAILPDHIHLTLRCLLAEPPEAVVLAYMNNLAYASGMKPIFRFSYYVGTFSEYDLGVIPRA